MDVAQALTSRTDTTQAECLRYRTRKSTWPNCTGLPFSATISAMTPADLGLDFVHHLHRLDDADDGVLGDLLADIDKRR